MIVSPGNEDLGRVRFLFVALANMWNKKRQVALTPLEPIR
jgi:hypothetical protein